VVEIRINWWEKDKFGGKDRFPGKRKTSVSGGIEGGGELVDEGLMQ
jgi:hypothetical protein